MAYLKMLIAQGIACVFLQSLAVFWKKRRDIEAKQLHFRAKT